MKNPSIAKLAKAAGSPMKQKLDVTPKPNKGKKSFDQAYQDKDNDGSKEYRKEVLQRLKEMGHAKRFACPGNCGNCIAKKEHACGSDKLRGVTIAIGIHT